MSGSDLVLQQRQHLGHLLEAIQRCVYFLEASDSAVPWPLTGAFWPRGRKALLEKLARRFFNYCVTELGAVPATDSFAAEFERATANGLG